MVVCCRREVCSMMAVLTFGWQWPTETVTMPVLIVNGNALMFEGRERMCVFSVLVVMC